MISYFIQIALAFLFGHLLPLIVRLSTKWSFRPILRRVLLVKKLLISVVQTSFFYSVSHYVAALVIYSQTPSISEFIILDPLLTLHGAIVAYLATGLCLGYLFDLELDREWILLTGVLEGSLLIVWIVIRVMFSLAPKEDLSYYHTSAEACHSQGSVKGGTVNSEQFLAFSATDYLTPADQQEQTFLGMTAMGSLIGAIVSSGLLYLIFLKVSCLRNHYGNISRGSSTGSSASLSSLEES